MPKRVDCRPRDDFTANPIISLAKQIVLAQVTTQLVVAEAEPFGSFLLIELALLHRLFDQVNLKILHCFLQVDGLIRLQSWRAGVALIGCRSRGF